MNTTDAAPDKGPVALKISKNPYRRCWMEMLGGCSDDLTREHVISDTVIQHCSAPDFGVTIMDSNGSPHKIGANAATIKNLCGHHNSGTSPLDNEAQHLYSAIESLVRKKPSEILIVEGASTEERIVIDGPLFERWTVKTFMNVYMSGIARNRDGNPPTIDLINRNLAEWVFNGRIPATPQGLYLIQSEVPLLKLRRPDAYAYNPIAFNIKHSQTNDERQFPAFLHVKMRSLHFGTIANLTTLSDEEYAVIAKDVIKANKVPFGAKPMSLGVASTPDGQPQTHTQLRIDFKW